MSFAFCVFITWLAVCVIAVIPKKLTEIEGIFLYFTNTIFELSLFTIFHVNLHWISIGNEPQQSLGDLINRIVFIPIVFVILTEISFYSIGLWKWVISAAVILLFVPLSKILGILGILHMSSHWNEGDTILLFSSYGIFSKLMAEFILNVDRRSGEKHENLR